MDRPSIQSPHGLEYIGDWVELCGGLEPTVQQLDRHKGRGEEGHGEEDEAGPLSGGGVAAPQGGRDGETGKTSPEQYCQTDQGQHAWDPGSRFKAHQ